MYIGNNAFYNIEITSSLDLFDDKLEITIQGDTKKLKLQINEFIRSLVPIAIGIDSFVSRQKNGENS